MRRWMWILLAIFSMQLLSEAGTEIENLEPVQLLYAESNGEVVNLKTDTGSAGTGRTLAEALEDMENKAVSRIFLETADYLVLGPGAKGLMKELKSVLRPAVAVTETEAPLDLMYMAKFLNHHRPKTKLMDLPQCLGQVEKLIKKEGRMVLVSDQQSAK